MGVEPTHLLGVLQHAAAHSTPQPLLTEVPSNMPLLLVWGVALPRTGVVHWFYHTDAGTAAPIQLPSKLPTLSAPATGVGVALRHRGVGPASRAGAHHGALHRVAVRRGWA
jgi:hypothetical protein